jgi:hypothetical protein
MEFERPEMNFDCVLPSAILFNKKIELKAVKLYAIIRGLTKKHGYCYATNGYLAELMEASERSITSWIIQLKDEKYLEIETQKNGIHWQRRIYLSDKFKECLRKETQFYPPSNPVLPPSQPASTILEDKLNEDKSKDLNSSSQPKKEKIVPSAQASALAQEFSFALKDSLGEDYKEPDLDQWTKDFDVWLRMEKPEPSIIRKVMNWAVNDSFWKSNIRCPSKLRKQFLTLKLQMERPKLGTKKSLKSQEAKWIREERNIPAENDILAQLLVK